MAAVTRAESTTTCSLNILAGAALCGEDEQDHTIKPSSRRKRRMRETEYITYTHDAREAEPEHLQPMQGQDEHQIRRRGAPVYDDLDPMLMASDPEAHAPMTYKQGYYETPFDRTDPVARKASRKNRSSYESICTDPVQAPTPMPSITERVQVSEERRYSRSSRKHPSQRSSFEHPPASFAAARDSAARVYSQNQMDLPSRPPMPHTEHGYAPSFEVGGRPQPQRQHPADSHFDQHPEDARSYHASYNNPAYLQDQSYDHHMDHRRVDRHPRSESVLEPSSYSHASEPHPYTPRDEVPYYAAQPAHSPRHPRREHLSAPQHMSHSMSEMRREPLSHSSEFEQGAGHEFHPGYFSHPRRGRQQQEQKQEMPDHLMQPNSAKQTYIIYCDRMPADLDEYSHRQPMTTRVVHDNVDYHRSNVHTRIEGSYTHGHYDCHKPSTSACSDGQHHVAKDSMHAEWTYIPKAQFHTQDEASFGGSAARIDRAPITKKIIFIEETGQKKRKRAKTKAASPVTAVKSRFVTV